MPFQFLIEKSSQDTLAVDFSFQLKVAIHNKFSLSTISNWNPTLCLF